MLVHTSSTDLKISIVTTRRPFHPRERPRVYEYIYLRIINKIEERRRRSTHSWNPAGSRPLGPALRLKQSNVNSNVNVNGICTGPYPSTRENAKGPVSKKKKNKKNKMVKNPWGNKNRTQPLSMYAAGQQISQNKRPQGEKKGKASAKDTREKKEK
jgi:hypothetical protein